MNPCAHYLVNFCFVVSWVAVPVLFIFTWVSHSEIKLLEVEETVNYSDVQSTLLYSALMYLIIALALTIYVFFVRPKQYAAARESPEQRQQRIAQNMQAANAGNKIDNFRGLSVRTESLVETEADDQGLE